MLVIDLDGRRCGCISVIKVQGNAEDGIKAPPVGRNVGRGATPEAKLLYGRCDLDV